MNPRHSPDFVHHREFPFEICTIKKFCLPAIKYQVDIELIPGFNTICSYQYPAWCVLKIKIYFSETRMSPTLILWSEVSCSYQRKAHGKVMESIIMSTRVLDWEANGRWLLQWTHRSDLTHFSSENLKLSRFLQGVVSSCLLAYLETTQMLSNTADCAYTWFLAGIEVSPRLVFD